MGQAKLKETRKKASLAQARADMYKFLASFYLNEPNSEIVANVANMKLINQLSEIFSTVTMAPLKKFTKKFDGDIEQVKQDWHGLFRVPLQKYTTPYESVYRENLMAQQTTVQVRKRYFEASSAVDRIKYSFHEDDYLGYELDFMRFLCETEAAGWNKDHKNSARTYLQYQNKFLKDHLSRWLPDVTKTIEKKADTDYFKFAARITKQFVANDIKEVKIILKESL